jgi:hypothetical protein
MDQSQDQTQYQDQNQNQDQDQNPLFILANSYEFPDTSNVEISNTEISIDTATSIDTERETKAPFPSTYMGTSSKHKLQTETTCAICFVDFVCVSDSACVVKDRHFKDTCRLSCYHHYHVDCIDQWLQRNQSCPLCRKPCKPLRKNNKTQMMPGYEGATVFNPMPWGPRPTLFFPSNRQPFVPELYGDYHRFRLWVQSNS